MHGMQRGMNRQDAGMIRKNIPVIQSETGMRTKPYAEEETEKAINNKNSDILHFKEYNLLATLGKLKCIHSS